MNRVDEAFRLKVYAIVAQIPKGRVMSYGQIATCCGEPRAAWEVGQIAHTGPADLPWQRVVNKQGGLAMGWPDGGRERHQALLVAEGIEVKNFCVDMSYLQWIPE